MANVARTAKPEQEQTLQIDDLTMTVVRNHFTLDGDLNPQFPLTKTGKSRSAFSTGGNKDTGVIVKNPITGKPMELRIGLNLFADVQGDEADGAANNRRELVDAAKEAEKNLAASKNA